MAGNERLVLCSGTRKSLMSEEGGGERGVGDAISAWHAAAADQEVC